MSVSDVNFCVAQKYYLCDNVTAAIPFLPLSTEN